MLSDAELASIQATANTTLTDDCTVQRAVIVNDGFGSQTESWDTVATTTARMGVPQGAYFAALAARLSEFASWQVSLPSGTDVQVKDQLLIRDQTLVVQSVYEPQTISSVTRVLASELR
jgi:head-tail adaptor